MMETITRWLNQVYAWISSFFVHDDVRELPEHFYDIYYHFKLLEKEGRIKATISNLYPDNSFDIKVLNSDSTFKIYKVGNTVHSDQYSGDDIYPKHRIHETFNSIESDIRFVTVLDNMYICDTV